MSDIVYIDCEQGSPEWHQARAGCITGSKVREIRAMLGTLTDQQQAYVNAIRSGASQTEAQSAAGYKKAPTSALVARAAAGEDVREFSGASHDLAFRLAVERITGQPLDDDEFSPWQAARGQRLEPEAREAHEVQHGVVVQPMGFIRTTDGKFGVSVDGLIGEEEGAEYKCFLAPSKLRRVLTEGDWSDVIDQCQFSMAVTGRKRWHMGLYCPQLGVIDRALTVHVAERDDDYIDAMWADLLRFDRLIESYRAKLTGKAGAEPEGKVAAELAPTF